MGPGWKEPMEEGRKKSRQKLNMSNAILATKKNLMLLLFPALVLNLTIIWI